jgi:hypothetical protein
MSEPDLLAAYDAQLRRVAPDPLPTGVGVGRDGPLMGLTVAAGGSSGTATSAASPGSPSTI